MAIYLNGNLVDAIIPANFHLNGVIPSKIYVNGVKAWEQKVAAGSQTFTSGGTFTVGTGIYSVNICLAGGGGSGATGPTSTIPNVYIGGGYAGQAVSQAVAVTPGQQITIGIGSGGAARTSHSSNGLPGSGSSFGAITASGGGAGTYTGTSSTCVYKGNGAGGSSCSGTRYDGSLRIVAGAWYVYGGQRGVFGNGGTATTDGTGVIGGVGAGGSAGGNGTKKSGAGGRGQCVVSWT